MKKGLFLVGFMGAGKSTLGRPLASALGSRFYDLDAEIVAGEGREISDIFKNDGESFFRDLEISYLKSCPLPSVIALGGGAFIQEPIREYIAEKGLSLYLDWPFSRLWERIQGDGTRPLVGERDALEARFMQRQPIYRQADIIWEPDPEGEVSPHQVVLEIVALTAPYLR